MGGWTDSEIPSLAAAPPKGPSCGSALLFPKGMGQCTLSPKGASPAPPSSQAASPGSSTSLIYMPASSCFPSYLNTALFLAAGNPSWADNTPLESDLKNFIFFFLMLEARKASAFSFFPGEGGTAAGSPTPGRPRWEHVGGKPIWGRAMGQGLMGQGLMALAGSMGAAGKRRCRCPGLPG